MKMLEKRKEKSSKKEKKKITAKTKYLGLRTRYAPSILSLLWKKQELFFCKLFLGRDIEKDLPG
jgi:hypothetical protein